MYGVQQYGLTKTACCFGCGRRFTLVWTFTGWALPQHWH